MTNRSSCHSRSKAKTTEKPAVVTQRSDETGAGVALTQTKMTESDLIARLMVADTTTLRAAFDKATADWNRKVSDFTIDMSEKAESVETDILDKKRERDGLLAQALALEAAVGIHEGELEHLTNEKQNGLDHLNEQRTLIENMRSMFERRLNGFDNP